MALVFPASPPTTAAAGYQAQNPEILDFSFPVSYQVWFSSLILQIIHVFLCLSDPQGKSFPHWFCCRGQKGRLN